MGLFDWFTLNKPDPPQAVVLPPLRRHILDFIEAWEGRKLVPYVDDAGYPTVGVGHKILSHEAFGECISEQECNVLLAKDFNDKRFAVAAMVRVPLETYAMDALTSFAFNLGTGALRDSTLLRMVNGGNFAAAGAQFDRWVNARDPRTQRLREVTGLVRRRAAERAMFERGDYSGRP